MLLFVVFFVGPEIIRYEIEAPTFNRGNTVLLGCAPLARMGERSHGQVG